MTNTASNIRELTPACVANELRYFADRSVYDALSAIYTRNEVQIKRVVRNFTLASVSKAAEDSSFPHLPDAERLGDVSEIGYAALWKITEASWKMLYTGIRGSHLMVNRDTGEVDIYVDIIASQAENSVSFAAMGKLDALNQLMGMLMDHFEPMLDRTAIRFELDAQGGIGSNKITLAEPFTYVEGLYPNVGTDPRHLYDAWANSRSRCLLFWGIPGGGKSSFMAQMVNWRGYKNLAIIDDGELMNHPQLINAIRSLPDGSLVVFEDADNLLAKREDGNTQMSALLNVISGIAERDIMFLFCTNLKSLNRIDDALLRGGRMFKSIEFKPFEQHQVNAIRGLLNLEAVGDDLLEQKKDWTLADIVHTDEGVTAGAKKQGFGFID